MKNACPDLYSVDSQDAATARDNMTLEIMTSDGKLLRISFGSKMQMQSMAMKMLIAVTGQETEVFMVPTTPVAATRPETTLAGAFGALDVASSSGSETEYGAPPSEPESSFDSYDGEGGALTQEVDWAALSESVLLDVVDN